MPASAATKRRYATAQDSCQNCRNAARWCDIRKPSCGQCIARAEGCPYSTAARRQIYPDHAEQEQPSTPIDSLSLRESTAREPPALGDVQPPSQSPSASQIPTASSMPFPELFEQNMKVLSQQATTNLRELEEEVSTLQRQLQLCETQRQAAVDEVRESKAKFEILETEYKMWQVEGMQRIQRAQATEAHAREQLQQVKFEFEGLYQRLYSGMHYPTGDVSITAMQPFIPQPATRQSNMDFPAPDGHNDTTQVRI